MLPENRNENHKSKAYILDHTQRVVISPKPALNNSVNYIQLSF